MTLHRISESINSSYALTISYYVVVMAVLLSAGHILGIYKPGESMAGVLALSGCLGAMLGVLHRKVFMPKSLSRGKRLGLGALIVLVSGSVRWMVLRVVHYLED